MEASQRAQLTRRMVSSTFDYFCRRLVLTVVLAGYTYCAIASLSLLHWLPSRSSTSSQTTSTSKGTPKTELPGLTNVPAIIRWLVSRQVGYTADKDEEDDEGDVLPQQDQRNALAGAYKDSTGMPSLADLSLQQDHFVGFNGRCNKRVDTCYAFWVGASLDVRLYSNS
jgi:geranylgeranyl transferase type-1 subunit beta